MPKNRLYIEGPIESGKTIDVRGDRARYVSRVLRLGPGDELTLFDGEGGEYPAVIRSLGKDRIVAEAGGRVDRSVESPLAVTLVQGISRGDRMDHVVQKTTELGVTRIVPVHTDFSVVKLDQRRAEKRWRHWRGIAASACEQCGRNRLPSIDPPGTLPNLLGECRDSAQAKLLLQPGVDATLGSIDAGDSGLIVLVGPEGGFSDLEREHAEVAGFTPVGLGPRILRTETAAVAALSALQTLYGDLS